MPPPTLMADSEVVYTPKEIAEFLTISEWKVNDLIRRGVLKAHRAGGTPENPRKPRVSSAHYREYLSRLPAYRPTGTTPAATS